MKKIYQIIMLCVMSVELGSCGGFNSNSTEINYHDSVAVACNNFDFPKAYFYAGKCGAEDEVIKKEGAYVLEQQGESGLVRISMIVNEHKAQWLYLDLMKMAISMGNETLATKIFKMSDDCDDQCIDYAITADMEGLINLFINKKDKYIDEENVAEYLKDKGTYDEKYKAIAKKRIEEINRNLKERETYLLKTNLPPIVSAINIVRKGSYDIQEKCEKYNDTVNKYNKKCLELLVDAINNKNLKIAQRAAKMPKKTVVFTYHLIKNGGTDFDMDNTYRVVVTHSSASITNAKNVLNEAIKEGKFK